MFINISQPKADTMCFLQYPDNIPSLITCFNSILFFPIYLTTWNILILCIKLTAYSIIRFCSILPLQYSVYIYIGRFSTSEAPKIFHSVTSKCLLSFGTEYSIIHNKFVLMLHAFIWWSSTWSHDLWSYINSEIPKITLMQLPCFLSFQWLRSELKPKLDSFTFFFYPAHYPNHTFAWHWILT